jgi:hypothetical protein
MKANALPEDADALLALAEAVATVLSEKQEYLGIGTEVEALLRAQTAAATFAINGYLAVVAGVKKSAAAQRYVAQAKARVIGVSKSCGAGLCDPSEISAGS